MSAIDLIWYTVDNLILFYRNREEIKIAADSGGYETVILYTDMNKICGQWEKLLTEKQMTSVELVWKNGMTLQEAAKVLGISHQAVDYNLNLGKKKLRRILDEHNKEQGAA